MINPRRYIVLLAEDDRRLRDTFTDQLTEWGFIPIVERNGEELYQAAKEIRGFPKLVIVSDTEMPKMNGDLACKRLLEDFPVFHERIMIGMSEEYDNEQYWDGIGIWQSFIHKGQGITSIENSTFGDTIYNRINTIEKNPSFYTLKNGVYRRGLQNGKP